MTFMTIPAASIAGMVFSLVVSFALPIGLFVYAKKKLGAKTAPFFIGCGVFFVMVLMLEAAIHRIVFQGKTCPLVYLGCIFVSVKIIDAFLSA